MKTALSPWVIVLWAVTNTPTLALAQQKPNEEAPAEHESATAAPTKTPQEKTDVPPVVTNGSPPPARPANAVSPMPNRVSLSGTPIPIRFRAQTEGVSFLLPTQKRYSSIRSVYLGTGLGHGLGAYRWGWGYYGTGYVDVLPYSLEVVTTAYEPICETPCEAELRTGRYRFALSLNGRTPVHVDRVVDLTSASVLEGRYVDKSRLRRAGWITFLVGTVAGLAMMLASINYRDEPRQNDEIRSKPAFYTGLGVLCGAMIPGIVLASRRDKAYIKAYPAP